MRTTSGSLLLINRIQKDSVNRLTLGGGMMLLRIGMKEVLPLIQRKRND
jgi:hypothetical protein